jgi:biopolymer transport protein ExbD
MGAGPLPPQKGGRRSLDAALNLVPFIDLLSCCIAFLLITAVWTQLARIEVTQPAGSTLESAPPTLELTLVMDPSGFTLSQSTGESRQIPARAGDFDYPKLLDVLRAVKAAHPDQKALTLRSDDRIPYRQLIRAMDTAIAADLPSISVADTGS